MVDFEITADAKEMLKFLYAVYLARRREGKERTQANNFGTTRDIHNRYFPQKSERDVRDICLELYRAGALLCILGDNIFFRVRLSDAAIVYSEQNFARNVQALLEWAARVNTAACL